MGLAAAYGADEFATIQELADAVGLAERHISRQRRLAYLALEVVKRLTYGREPSAWGPCCRRSSSAYPWRPSFRCPAP